MNTNTPEWREIAEEIDRRVTELDVKNRFAKSWDETQHIRGQIAALLSLKEFPLAAAIPEESEVSFGL